MAVGAAHALQIRTLFGYYVAITHRVSILVGGQGQDMTCVASKDVLQECISCHICLGHILLLTRPSAAPPFEPGCHTAHQLISDCRRLLVCVHGSTEGTSALYRAQIPVCHRCFNPMMNAHGMFYGRYMGRHDMGRHGPVNTVGEMLWCACLVPEPCGVTRRFVL